MSLLHKSFTVLSNLASNSLLPFLCVAKFALRIYPSRKGLAVLFTKILSLFSFQRVQLVTLYLSFYFLVSNTYLASYQVKDQSSIFHH